MDNKIEVQARVNEFIQKETFRDTELVFGIVGAVGTDLKSIVELFEEKLKNFYHYNVVVIDVSTQILSKHLTPQQQETVTKGEFERVTAFMDKGNELRKAHGEGILAMAVADFIQEKRFSAIEGSDESPLQPLFRTAFIIKSIKNKKEIEVLRQTYGNGFYLIGVYEAEEQRIQNLLSRKNIIQEKAKELIRRDEDEESDFGQQTRDAYQQADIFIDNSNQKRAAATIYRFIKLIFGEPYSTPTFDEFSMYLAFGVSLRSADLSRQVGAVICRDNEPLAMGANDCPKFGGGLYWAQYSDEKGYYDEPSGKDYMRGEDSNKVKFISIAKAILEKLNVKDINGGIEDLKETPLAELTEYARVVHAEMESISMCARNNISCKDATMYVTTFPCHNCAKHIIAAGIKRVIYIEAYPKSKALEFYDDSISTEPTKKNIRVIFEPFFGVGPRRYHELFAMNANPLPTRIRKDKANYGKRKEWEEGSANVRSQMLPSSYIDREMEQALYYQKALTRIQDPTTSETIEDKV